VESQDGAMGGEPVNCKIKDYSDLINAYKKAPFKLKFDWEKYSKKIANRSKFISQCDLVIFNNNPMSENDYMTVVKYFEDKCGFFSIGFLPTIAKFASNSLCSDHHIGEKDIAKAKSQTKYTYPGDILHEHPDCIRIAYEWLDAQLKTKNPTYKMISLKHIIEKWGGRYVSRNDVEVAATLLGLNGSYPRYQISAKLTRPSDNRLKLIKEARTQSYKEDSYLTVYKRTE